MKQEIIVATKKLADNPEMYPPDKYRKDKDVRFRAFEKYSYRISKKGLKKKKKEGFRSTTVR